MEYTEKVLEHFRTPHNVGVIEDADGTGKVGDASCGDAFLMFITVRDERLTDIKYLVQGCGAAIATCSALSDVAMGKTLDEAMELTDDDIAEELDGLPLEKLHCSNLAATVLHRAIADYRRRQKVDLRNWRSLYQR
ncbi:MAG: iron-sulfur cluster assembly scaffold protein [Anaerolineae bacterium]|nr:iron-sulfur cluster assembly scaffold protein [Anaerolineae bacterium]